MLILTRKEGEVIVAGDIRITVTKLLQGKVRLGIQAPYHTLIYREEIADAFVRPIRKRKAAAARPDKVRPLHNQLPS